MSPLTATGLLTISIGFGADSRRYRQTALCPVGICTLIGTSLLVVHADIISPFLGAKLFHFAPEKTGRTVTATAGCLTALGLAELKRQHGKHVPRLLGAHVFT